MSKNLNIFYKISIIFLLVLVASCSAKNVANKNTNNKKSIITVTANNTSKNASSNSKLDDTSKNSKKQKTTKKAPEVIATIKETTEKDKLKQAKAEEKKEQIQKKENVKTKATIKTSIGFFTPKQVKLLAKNFVKAKNVVISPLKDNEGVFLINTVSPNETSFEYYKKITTNFKTIGFSILNYGSTLNPEYIKRIARYNGANVVIVKRVYNADSDKYIYDIIYLNGDVNDNNFYWMRNSKEAIPVNVTISNIAKQKVVLNKYSIEVILKTNKEENTKKEQTNNSQSANNASIRPIIDFDADPSSLIISNPNNTLGNKKAEEASNSKVASLSDTDKMINRVSNIVGLWMDSYDKSIVQIQEIDANTIKAKNKDAFISSKVKYYGAYIVLNSAKATKHYNSYREINDSNTFDWHNQDLKFQFNSSGKNSIYLNYNKMPQVAIIKAYPVKGVLMIALANGETRYLIPLGMDVSPKFIKDLYKHLPSHINGKEASFGKNASYGSGMYGWIISSGAILLGLGLVSMF